MKKHFYLGILGLLAVSFLSITNLTATDLAGTDPLEQQRPPSPMTLIVEGLGSRGKSLGGRDKDRMEREARRELAFLTAALRKNIWTRCRPERDITKLTAHAADLEQGFFAGRKAKPTIEEHQRHLEQVKEILIARIKAGEFDERPGEQQAEGDGQNSLSGSDQEAASGEQRPPSPFTRNLQRLDCQGDDTMMRATRLMVASLARDLRYDIARRFPMPRPDHLNLAREFVKLENEFFIGRGESQPVWEEYEAHVAAVVRKLTARFESGEFDLPPEEEQLAEYLRSPIRGGETP